MLFKAGESIAAWQIVATIVLLYLAQLVLKAIYRITLHPLAKFPGPILAALTYKYEFYFDGIKGGQYLNEIVRLHQIYGTNDYSLSVGSCTNSLAGPIVRINPNELHCNDPNFVDQIYAGAGKRRHKWSYWVNAYGVR